MTMFALIIYHQLKASATLSLWGLSATVIACNYGVLGMQFGMMEELLPGSYTVRLRLAKYPVEELTMWPTITFVRAHLFSATA